MKILKKMFFVMMLLILGAGAAYAKEVDLSKTTLKDVNGMEYSFGKQGKETYVKFWASWCPICLSGLEDLDKLSMMENKNFEIVTIVTPGIKGEKKAEDFKKWYKSLEYKNIKVLLDEKGELVKALNIRVYPTSAVIDVNGKVKKIIPGHLEKMEIKKLFSSKMDNNMSDMSMNKNMEKSDMMESNKMEKMHKDMMKGDKMKEEMKNDMKETNMMKDDKMNMEKKTMM